MNKILPDNSPNKAYKTLYFIFSDLFNTAFPKRETEIETKRLQSPGKLDVYWSHPNERLYEKFLKKRVTENETIYNKYKYLFEKIKKKSKASYYQRKLKIFEGDIKKI